MADYEEIDLSALSDDELVEQMHNDLYDGMRDEIVEDARTREREIRLGAEDYADVFDKVTNDADRWARMIRLRTTRTSTTS